MELTIDDCMALAARESATEPELRAAVCVAVGQALHHRYEANGYNEAAEVARRDADRFLADWHSAKRERSAAQAEAKAARESMEEARELLRIARDDGEMFARQRDEARARASMLAQDLARAVEERDDARARVAMEERDRARAVQERESFSLRLSAAERERDEARAALDAAIARPTYEARTVAPTIAEWRGHFRAGGSWIVLRPQWVPLVTILRGAARSTDDAPISGWTVTDGRLVREVSP